MDRIAMLKNNIQEYSWGSKSFIPELLGEPAPTEVPQAELWMGTHPGAPSGVLCNDELMSLPDLIQKSPEAILGSSTARKFFNNLPFLFKVLAAVRPLSIQAHPNRRQAAEGFAFENRKNMPPLAPDRNYRDKNHKPELFCALRPFSALKGFRKIDDILRLTDLIGLPAKGLGADLLRSQPNNEGLKEFFNRLMTMSKELQQRVVDEIVACIEHHGTLDPAFEWVIRLNREYPGDIGVISPIFLNLIRLRPGEAIYIPAGELHSYLEGAGLELMANSDNVLRGGLTAKPKDTPELLKVLNFNSQENDILTPKKIGRLESYYPCPAEEFMLSVLSLHRGVSYKSPLSRSVEIMICTGGEARIRNLGSGEIMDLSRGNSIIVPAAVKQYWIEGVSTIYKASVPM